MSESRRSLGKYIPPGVKGALKSAAHGLLWNPMRHSPPHPQSIDPPLTSSETETAVDLGPRRISNLVDLDKVLLEVDAAAEISDDAMRAVFKTFEFEPDSLSLPPDPFSKEYADFQLELYRRIAGKDYNVDNERTDYLSHFPADKVPFPYCTGSFLTVSDHLLMVGLIIKIMALPQTARVLDLGPGFGNTTVALAKTGYDVTAIDIDERFLARIAAACNNLPNPPRLLAGDYSRMKESADKFNAILFFESFHHSFDHMETLRACRDKLAEGGKIVFASEPITNVFTSPWGLRLDGMSLWSIRRSGWLELGFREDYFVEALRRASLKVQKHHFPVTDLGTIFVAEAI